MTPLNAIECVGVFVGWGGVEVGVLNVVDFAGFHDVGGEDEGGYHGEAAGAGDNPAVAVGDCDDWHDWNVVLDDMLIS